MAEAQAPALRTVARWPAHLHGLATATDEISGLLMQLFKENLLRWHVFC
jgi:hypothetical protein